MIKEIKLPQSVYENSWSYWKKYDYYYLSYYRWLTGEYKISLHEKRLSYDFVIEGEEKDLTLFLLRWS